MIEIKRLSDEDIEWLRNAHTRHSSECTMCPLHSLEEKMGCDTWGGGCRNAASKAIELEMEARRKDRMKKDERLNDADISWLKGPATKRCNRCPIGKKCEVVSDENFTCESFINDEVKKEMEARKKDKMEEKILKTESEVRAELEKTIKKINNGCTTKGFSLYLKKDEILKQFFTYYNDQPIGNAHEFRPDIEPPAKNMIVQDRDGKLWFSSGFFTKHGELRSSEKPNGGGANVFLTQWITIDRTQCSDNWDHELEKGWGL